jgi:hypothetical protein
VTSEQLYALGIELMERAVTNSKEATHITKVDAFDYRDGLIIALSHSFRCADVQSRRCASVSTW